jgi:hypothetical protein
VLAESEANQLSNKYVLWSEREWDIPTWFWTSFTGLGKSRLDWELGKFVGNGIAQRKQQKITLSGVHFLRSALLPQHVPALPAEAEFKNPGGRKPTHDWDAAVAAIWGSIYRGDFKPTNQAAIEREMQKWLARGDQEPSESTVRPYARRIWEQVAKA